MRKLLLAIGVALIFLTASVGNAAWTITETDSPIKIRGSEAVIVKLACVSDASGTDYQLTTDVIGFYLYDIRTVLIYLNDYFKSTHSNSNSFSYCYLNLLFLLKATLYFYSQIQNPNHGFNIAHDGLI